MSTEQKVKVAEGLKAERLLELYEVYTDSGNLLCTEEERKEVAQIIKAEILKRMSR